MFTSILSIPPNYIYGDRSQFSCPISINIASDARGVFVGLDMYTDCHSLTFGLLEFTKMTHKLYLGQPASQDCLLFDPQDTDFPVVVLSEYSEAEIPLGNFIRLLKSGLSPHATLVMNPTTGKYIANFSTAEVMVLGTSFTSSLVVRETGFTTSSSAKIYNLYDCDISVSGPLDNTWNNVPLTVEGTLPPRLDFVNQVTSNTLEYLRMLSKEASTKRRLAVMALNKTEATAERLRKDLNEQETVVNDIKYLQEKTQNDQERYSELITELTQNLTQLGEASRELLSNLDSICTVTPCLEECVPDTVTRNCTSQRLVKRWGSCPSQCERITYERILVRTGSYPCSTWQTTVTKQKICECPTLAICSCRIVEIINRCCCPDTCFGNIYTSRRVVTMEPCFKACIVDEITESVQRECEVRVECASRQVDPACVRSNSLCRAQRDTALNSLQDESAQTLKRLEQAKKEKAAVDIRLRRLTIQLNSAVQLKNRYEQGLSNLNLDRLRAELERIEKDNKELLELEPSLSDPDNPPFTIRHAGFEMTVVRGTPRKFPIHFTVSVQRNGENVNKTVSFDFDNPKTSLYQVSTILGAAVIGDSSLGRRRRQAENGADDAKALFEEQCVTLSNIAAFFNSLHISVSSLQNETDDEKSETLSIAAQLEDQAMGNMTMPDGNMDALKQFNVTIDPETLLKMAEEDDELVALLELRQALVDKLKNIANGTSGQNVFVIWRTEVNNVLNKSGENFGYACSSLIECFAVAVNVLEGILQTAPSEMVGDLKTMLSEAEPDLEELSTSSDLSLQSAVALLDRINTVLANMVDLNYWCAQTPNITQSPETNVTAVENGRLELKCQAESEFSVSYQWKKDDVVLPTQSSSTLVIGSVQVSDEGFYTCDASNHVGTTTSTWSYVDVHQPPVFYREPDDQERIVGDSRPAVLICNATSSPDPQFRWYFKSKGAMNFTLLRGKVGSILQIESPREEDEGTYRCEAWNEVTSAYSRSAYLSVHRYSAAVMGIPLQLELTACDGEELNISKIESIVHAAVSSTSDTELEQLVTITDEDTSTVSFLLYGENVTNPDIFPEPVQSISSRVPPSRGALTAAVSSLTEVLLTTAAYTSEGLPVCEVEDSSENKFVFKCGEQQQLDEDNILCSEWSDI